jgi:hypothetical protein
MSDKAHLLFFCCSPVELGWERMSGLRAHPELEALADAILVDTAEYWSSNSDLIVRVYETKEHSLDGMEFSTTVERYLQQPGLLRERITSAMQEIYGRSESARVILFLGRHPLYPLPLIQSGVALLNQDDDVVIMGESTHRVESPPLLWFAAKHFQPLLMESGEEWWTDSTSYLQRMVQCKSLVMAMKPVRAILTDADLAYLHHEVERKLLLGQWYPSRTHDILYHLHRRGMIQEDYL